MDVTEKIDHLRFRSASSVSKFELSIKIVLVYFTESECQLACIIKNFHLRVSPSFIHTLTVARNLWTDWRPGAALPWSITAPYIICNNMNHPVA